MAEQQVAGWVEYAYPVWVVVESGAAARDGNTFAAHFLTALDGPDRELPVFTTEELARKYVANRPLPGHEPAPIADATDFVIQLELFRKRGGTHVRLDDADGPTEGWVIYPLADFIALVRKQG